ncbi:ribosomal protein L35 [Piptocephalis cylindrospora]|uniref:50S ribosomal protein L35 n=1 Tax=Piptocephalis cylindrospora TaxID=1907219 RepID=A0A4P9Y1F5_9FUNG|nr:ribosomal protein L35 [Piptocephalis cylindrospora]|eukprot:RKP12342.1 ribosomal protein L35 [Piptocephalis cylindrospora]
MGYKLKSHSGAKKRWTLTGSGLWKRQRSGKRHLNHGMSPQRIRDLRKPAFANPAQARQLYRLLPYGA